MIGRPVSWKRIVISEHKLVHFYTGAAVKGIIVALQYDI
jgi:hypothetical protein